MGRIVSQSSAASFASSLKAANLTTYATVSVGLPIPPATQVSVTLQVTTLQTALAPSLVQSSISSAVNGGASVTAIVATATTILTTTSTTTEVAPVYVHTVPAAI